MHIGIIGINHKSADLPLREKLAFASEKLFGSAHFLHPLFCHVLLSTCNRTEIYFSSDDPSATHTYLLNALRQYIKEEFEHRIYSYFGSDCFFHLARVTAGIDSALIGETEIQGQVKRAYEMALNVRFLDSALHFLFQKCLKIGKNIRSHTRFFQDALSIEEAVIHAAFEHLQQFLQSKVLFVGFSEINKKILVQFKKLGLREITFCNRTEKNLVKGTILENVNILPWDRLFTWPQYDLVICGTKAPTFILFESNQPIKTQLIIDLSVPRNVNPKLADHLVLLNVDQLNQNLDQKRCLKAAEIARLETVHIAQAVNRQVSLFKLRETRQSLFAQVS